MPLLIDDWKVLRAHVEDLPGMMVLYRIDHVGDKARLRVKAGQLAMDRSYTSKDEGFDELMRFLDEKGAVVVREQRPDDVFFQ
jgi:N-formylglutamate amidohydrolase